MSKNITIISPNFYPEDTAIGLYNSQLSKFLVDNNYSVTVITAFPYYPQWEIYKAYQSKPYLFEETINGVRILRSKQYVPASPTFFKRILHLLSFTFGSFLNLFKTTKPDLVISVIPFTTTVFLGGLLKLWYRSKLWVHVQDFEFDAANQSGLGKKTALFKGLFWIEKALLNKANMTSTISDSMIKMLRQKTNVETYFLPNWIDENQINPNHITPHRFLETKKIKILYSGNIGEKQDWNIFIQFCKDVNPSKYQIVVVGHGAKKQWLVDQISNFSHVKYFPPVPFEELSELLCSADLHILFQKTEIVDTVMPSKILGMMGSGKPSLVIGNNQSEIRKAFEDSKAGLYFQNYSKAIIENIEELLNNPQRCSKMGQNARQYVQSNFSKNQVLNDMQKKIKHLLNKH